MSLFLPNPHRPSEPFLMAEERALEQTQFPVPESRPINSTELRDRLGALCSSEFTRGVANLWFDYYEQGGSMRFFTNPHPYVANQFEKIQLGLRKVASSIANVVHKFGADAPSSGIEGE